MVFLRRRPRRASSRRGAPFKRRRTVRKYSAKRPGISKSRFGRVANLTPMVRNIAPIALTKLTRRGTVRGSLSYSNESGTAVTDFVKNWVVRANDVVEPTCTSGQLIHSGSGVNWATNWIGTASLSALGLNRLAPMYREHNVYAFGYRLYFRHQLLQNTSSNMDYYIGWRITDDAPTDISTSSSSQKLSDTIVHTRGSGWRFKRFFPTQTRQSVTVLKGVIPIRKFYKYPIFTRPEQQDQYCDTPDNTPANWTSPKNPCYFQIVMWANGKVDMAETIVPDVVDGGAAGTATGTTTASAANSFVLNYSMNYCFDFYTRSSERHPDMLLQSSTTDGGVDATNDVEEVATTSTWTAGTEDV